MSTAHTGKIILILSEYKNHNKENNSTIICDILNHSQENFVTEIKQISWSCPDTTFFKNHIQIKSRYEKIASTLQDIQSWSCPCSPLVLMDALSLVKALLNFSCIDGPGSWTSVEFSNLKNFWPGSGLISDSNIFDTSGVGVRKCDSRSENVTQGRHVRFPVLYSTGFFNSQQDPAGTGFRKNSTGSEIDISYSKLGLINSFLGIFFADHTLFFILDLLPSMLTQISIMMENFLVHLGVFLTVVYGYGNFAILIQSDTFSSTPYPIHIRKLKIMDSDIQSKSETAHWVAR